MNKEHRTQTGETRNSYKFWLKTHNGRNHLKDKILEERIMKLKKEDSENYHMKWWTFRTEECFMNNWINPSTTQGKLCTMKFIYCCCSLHLIVFPQLLGVWQPIILMNRMEFVGRNRETTSNIHGFYILIKFNEYEVCSFIGCVTTLKQLQRLIII